MLFNAFRRLVYLVGIPYTLTQLAGWYVPDGQVTTLAVVDKTAQVLRIVSLAYLFWSESRKGRPPY